MKYKVGFGLCLALIFVWSVPGTIALRGLLLLAALVVLASAAAGAELRPALRRAAVPLAVVALLSAWFVLQAVVVSDQPRWAFEELRGQWLIALVALAAGLLLGVAAPRRAAAASWLVTGIALVLALQAAAAVAHVAWQWLIGSGQQSYLMPLTGGKLEMSFVLNILLAILTVDLFCRATRRPPQLHLPLPAVLALLLLALWCSYLAGARNGILGILFLSVSAVSLFVFDQRRRLGPRRTLLAAGGIVAALAAFAIANYQADPRWQSFGETAAIAWDIDRHDTWIDTGSRPWPRLPDGREVDRSAYVRIAYIHGGLRLIAESPLGVGYGRNAFAHALKQRHPEARLGHAHSGWIDLGVGGGIPALLLWAAFIGSLMWRGWRSFFATHNPHGLLLFFLATGYAGRMALDSVNKDHMLQMFLFLVGLLLVRTRPREAVET
jgi:O-antigen ligase